MWLFIFNMNFAHHYCRGRGSLAPSAPCKVPRECQKSNLGIARAEPDDPCAETKFRLSEKRTSPFESVLVSGQSAGSNVGQILTCISLSIAGLPPPFACFH
jgi:hypothetical protein